MFNFDISQLPIYLMRIPVLLFALTVHEFSHGYIAYKLGDYTAKITGRLSLNPLRHLDPVGAICMLVFGFGWAKPVPIDTRNFKNPKRGMALSALAGPVANFILAFIGMFLSMLAVRFLGTAVMSGNMFAYAIILFLNVFYMLNLGLAVFNMLPIPPLDGSRIFLIFLPTHIYFKIMQYERYIMMGMFALIFFGVLDRPLFWLINAVGNGMATVLSFLPFL
jgi:Zn-dependent proteases